MKPARNATMMPLVKDRSILPFEEEDAWPVPSPMEEAERVWSFSLIFPATPMMAMPMSVTTTPTTMLVVMSAA